MAKKNKQNVSILSEIASILSKTTKPLLDTVAVIIDSKFRKGKNHLDTKRIEYQEKDIK